MDEQRERERETLEVLELFLSLSLRFCPYVLMGAPPPPPSSILLQGASGTHAPLATPLLFFLLHLLLPLAPSACLPSLLPGGPGQCWRRSLDLQEICLSEKQLVCLSTANVCMLGPPPPLPTGNTRTS